MKRNTDGKELSCSSAGGNGKVFPGQANRWFMFLIRILHAMWKYYHPSIGTLVYA
ncbi:hypothetical protein [Bacillus sp. B19-2]|uniref:hypothetical protein n=1 Tax=Bacillus sp. B19-2 TaxID=2929516 RepID=UPI001FBA1F54|nr:hypothetical protein [Bacillus sp. B19-2]MCJ2145021.1 hypothetical protein [Bacillus sp. B19-2]